MKYIELGIHITDDLGIKSVVINHNDTELKTDSKLIETVAMALLSACVSNKETLVIQDTLSDCGLKLQS